MIIDTSVLYCYFVRTDPDHIRVRALIESSTDAFIVSPFVIAELDYLIERRFGVDAELAMLNELSASAWQLAEFDSEDLFDSASIVKKYADLRVGATDASLVVLAHRFRTHTIATLDRRHFESMRALDGKPFEIVPAL